MVMARKMRDPARSVRANDTAYVSDVAAHLPAGFIAPCLPTKTDKLPSGGEWLHEIRHDGFGSLPARLAYR
jgi:ATP-dependent DNA ligase